MNKCAPKKLCFVTTTRADWGLLMPLAKAMACVEGVKVQIVAANMHLMPEYGMTVNEIVEAGFEVDARVPMEVPGDDERSRVKAMSLCMAQMADVFAELKPDALVILGDRYEILAVASAAVMMHVPIVHIAGGEISEGAVDDSIRHAVTKMSHLHLTAAEPYLRRVVQMGEWPTRVFNTGAIGVWNAFNTTLMGAAELGKELKIDFDTAKVAVVTYHPATNDSARTPAERVGALLEALDTFPELTAVITYPNNDAHGAPIIDLLEEYAARNSGRVRLVRSLGMVRYQSLLRLASVVIGNSSSGIVEAPSAGVPTVDIGMRQRGRIMAPSVIRCGDSAEEICEAIAKALSPQMQRLAAMRENPYHRKNTLELMVSAIKDFLASLPAGPKKFYDIWNAFI